MRKCPRCNGSLIHNRLTGEYYCLLCGYTQGGKACFSDDHQTNYLSECNVSGYRRREYFVNDGIHINLTGGS